MCHTKYSRYCASVIVYILEVNIYRHLQSYKIPFDFFQQKFLF